MPEKGWKVITVREGTKEVLLKESRLRKTSINDLILDALVKLTS